jgi:hypothetical protein
MTLGLGLGLGLGFGRAFAADLRAAVFRFAVELFAADLRAVFRFAVDLFAADLRAAVFRFLVGTITSWKYEEGALPGSSVRLVRGPNSASRSRPSQRV